MTGDPGRAVTANSSFYVPYDRKAPDQSALRAALRERLAELVAGSGQLLHAVLTGVLPPRTDVENALLYSIDDSGGTLAQATTNGVRFELDTSLAARPGAASRYRYDYRLAPVSGGFAHWRLTRELATWDGVELDARAARSSSHVWLAMRRRGAHVAAQERSPGQRFAVVVEIRGAPSALGSVPGVVKPLFDGVISSLQSHRHPEALHAVLPRLAALLATDTAELRDHLSDPARAPLGPAPRLVAPWGSSLQWNPTDDACVAGEIRVVCGGSQAMTMSGRAAVVEPAG